MLLQKLKERQTLKENHRIVVSTYKYYPNEVSIPLLELKRGLLFPFYDDKPRQRKKGNSESLTQSPRFKMLGSFCVRVLNIASHFTAS